MATTVLMGFDEPAFENNIVRYFQNRGYEVRTVVKRTKATIRDYLRSDQDCRTVILKEVNENVKYTADELATLTDEKELNLVVVLNDRHRGTEYMEILYRAGITSAIFQSGRKRGASVKDIAELAIHKRSRREAREYYGLEDKTVELGFLGNDTFVEYYASLNSPEYGDTLLERLINVLRRMNASQMGDFIRRLPDDVIDEVKKYEEFWKIVDVLLSVGVEVNIKRPKNLSLGLMTGEQAEDQIQLMTYQIEHKLSPADNWMDEAERKSKQNYHAVEYTPQDEEKAEEEDLYDIASNALFGLGGGDKKSEENNRAKEKNAPVSSKNEEEEDNIIPISAKKKKEIVREGADFFDINEYQKERMKEVQEARQKELDREEKIDYGFGITDDELDEEEEETGKKKKEKMKGKNKSRLIFVALYAITGVAACAVVVLCLYLFGIIPKFF